MELTIGKLPADLQNEAVTAIERLGLASCKWHETPQCTTISLLNIASVCLFTDYVAKIEGFADSAAALERTRFRNLPWWSMSIWVPFPFQPPQEPAINTGGWPIFLGSCQGLLADLAEIQRLSNLALGLVPDGYEKMRADYRAFFKSGFRLSDDRSIVQWVWRGLHDGAELAVRQCTPLLGLE